MTARNDDDRRDADYDGVDALMAALTDDPLPEGARRDASFMAAHRAATADVTLLREQLLLIGETLARDTGTEAGAAGTEPEASARTGEEAGDPAGRATAVGSAVGVEPEVGTRIRGEAGGAVERATAVGSAVGVEPEVGTRVRGEAGGAVERATAVGSAVGVEPEVGTRVRGEAGDPEGRAPAIGPAAATRAAGSGAAAGPAVSGLEPETAGQEAGAGAGVVALAGRRGRRRALGVALRGVAAAVAAGVVVGMGWLVVQGNHGSADDAAGSTAADSAAGPARGEASAKLGHAGYLACARLVAEGTVAEVERVPGTGQDRVTLDVDRSYKPAKGQDRVVFPMDEDAVPRPRPGDRVLVGITRGQAQPDLWRVGEKAIAPERAWITAALPGSATLPCE
ncbi:hypothetical protein [Streptomyces sp. NPDC050416]|uniref:hypothetical protein n=1 Tax=Streptomyces sp. NPDC050416 TaxID=3365611 RepID=UPI0037AD4562